MCVYILVGGVRWWKQVCGSQENSQPIGINLNVRTQETTAMLSVSWWLVSCDWHLVSNILSTPLYNGWRPSGQFPLMLRSYDARIQLGGLPLFKTSNWIPVQSFQPHFFVFVPMHTHISWLLKGTLYHLYFVRPIIKW